MDYCSYIDDSRWSGQASDLFPGEEFPNLLFNYFNGSNEGIIGGEAEMRGFMVKCGERPLEGEGMRNSCEAPHERWCYGNCGMHVGRYLVLAGLDYWIMSQDCKMHFPGMSCSTSEYIKWDAVVADGDGVCEN